MAKLSTSNEIINVTSNNLLTFDKKIISHFKDSVKNPMAVSELMSLNDLRQIVLGEAPQALSLCRENAILYFETSEKKYKNLYNAAKDQLNYVTISGVISGNRSDANLTYNGMCQIDIDCKYKGGDFAALQIQSYLLQNPPKFLVMAALSPSGHGVKCIVATNNENPLYHKTVLESLKLEFAELLKSLHLGYEIDNLGLSQACYIPYDSNAFFNESFEPFVYTHVAIEKAFEVKSKKYVSDSNSIQYTSNSIEIAVNTKLDMIESIIKKRNLFNDSRNCLVYQLCTMSKEYAIDIYDALSYCLNYVESDFDQPEIKRVVYSAYRTSPKTTFQDYQLLAYAKKLNTYIPNDILTSKPRLFRNDAFLQKDTILEKMQGTQDEYLSDILKKYNYELTPQNFTNKVWIVPTGTGKTYTVGQFAKNHNTIIVCPTNGLTDMCAKYGATIFRGDKQDIQSVLQSKFIATNYASFVTLCQKMREKQDFVLYPLTSKLYRLKSDLKNTKQAQTQNEIKKEIQTLEGEIQYLQKTDILKRYHIVIDEFHNIVANASRYYQLDDLENILGWCKHCASITGITGTYLKSNYIQLPLMIVEKPQKRISLHVVSCSVVRDTLINKVNESIANKRFPIVLLNNTALELERVKAALSGHKIAYFNAYNKDDNDFQNLVQNGTISEQLKGIVTTTVLKEGIDILSNGNYDIYIIGRFHSSTIKQFIARIRSKDATVNAFLLRSKDATNDTEQRFNYDLEKFNLENRAKIACEILNLTKKENNDPFIAKLEVSILHQMESLPVHFSEQTQRYEVQKLLFDNFLYEIETTFEHQNLELLKNHLAKLSIDLTENDIPMNDNETFALEMLLATQDKKVSDLNEFTTILSDLEGNPLTAKQTVIKQYKNNKASKIAAKTYKTLKKCLDYGYTLTDAIQDLRKNVDTPSDKRFKEFLGMTKAFILRTDNNYMQQNSIVAIQIQKMIKDFEGQKVTSSDVMKLMIETLRLNKAVNIERYEKAMLEENLKPFASILDLFFNVNRTRNGKKSHAYHFTLHQMSIRRGKSFVSEMVSIEKEPTVILDPFEDILEGTFFNFMPIEMRDCEVPF